MKDLQLAATPMIASQVLYAVSRIGLSQVPMQDEEGQQQRQCEPSATDKDREYALKREEPSQPSELSQPSEPSQPLEPPWSSEPPQPSEFSQPSEPPQPSEACVTSRSLGQEQSLTKIDDECSEGHKDVAGKPAVEQEEKPVLLFDLNGSLVFRAGKKKKSIKLRPGIHHLWRLKVGTP